jgi:ATP-dependent Clp protease protease subunit
MNVTIAKFESAIKEARAMMPNELWIYDIIGAGFFEEGVTAKSVRDELAKMDKKQRVSVRINSPGGDVFEAVAIRAQLEQWPAGVDVQVDGIAASAASYIATVGETVSMAEGSMFMVHDPWTIAIGNAAEMQKAAATLDKIADSLVGAYAKKAGKTDAEVRETMKAETWLTVDEAIEYGLADSKSDERAAAFAIPKAFGFKHPPQPAEPPKPRPANKLAALQRQLDLARIGA